MNATPWTRKDLVVTAGISAVGCLLWAIGWSRVAGEPASDRQIASLNVAIAGLTLVGVSYALWFLAGRRAVGVRRRLLLTPAVTTSGARATPTTVGADLYVGAERFFHRRECAMADDRDWAAVAKVEHLRAGRVACGVCAP